MKETMYSFLQYPQENYGRPWQTSRCLMSSCGAAQRIDLLTCIIPLFSTMYGQGQKGQSKTRKRMRQMFKQQKQRFLQNQPYPRSRLMS